MKKSDLSTYLLILIFVAGLSLVLYPTFSNYWNTLHSSRVIGSYIEQVNSLDQDKYDEIWQAAWDYNASLLARNNNFILSEEQEEEYLSLLNITTSGVMGYVEVPSVGINVPIYHGSSDDVLQIAAGHLEWTSLPVGGESSHCVISGHRGLPSARLFTDLDKVVEGDIFTIRILDEVLTYQVDQILIVLPQDTKPLLIEPGKDLCTLVTCTPYGINSHRMLVRGHRIETEKEAVTIRITADAVQVEPLIVAPIIAIPLLFLALSLLALQNSIRKSKNNKKSR